MTAGDEFGWPVWVTMAVIITPVVPIRCARVDRVPVTVGQGAVVTLAGANEGIIAVWGHQVVRVGVGEVFTLGVIDHPVPGCVDSAVWDDHVGQVWAAGVAADDGIILWVWAGGVGAVD